MTSGMYPPLQGQRTSLELVGQSLGKDLVGDCRSVGFPMPLNTIDIAGRLLHITVPSRVFVNHLCHCLRRLTASHLTPVRQDQCNVGWMCGPDKICAENGTRAAHGSHMPRTVIQALIKKL